MDLELKSSAVVLTSVYVLTVKNLVKPVVPVTRVLLVELANSLNKRKTR
jgi:hypothetical protein